MIETNHCLLEYFNSAKLAVLQSNRNHGNAPHRLEGETLLVLERVAHSWVSARAKCAVASGWTEVHQCARIGSCRLLSTGISHRLTGNINFETIKFFLTYIIKVIIWLLSVFYEKYSRYLWKYLLNLFL